LHFGLGDACLIDDVSVTRPGGAAASRGAFVGNTVVALE
jgi:hypothetical protein